MNQLEKRVCRLEQETAQDKCYLLIVQLWRPDGGSLFYQIIPADDLSPYEAQKFTGPFRSSREAKLWALNHLKTLLPTASERTLKEHSREDLLSQVQISVTLTELEYEHISGNALTSSPSFGGLFEEERDHVSQP